MSTGEGSRSSTPVSRHDAVGTGCSQNRGYNAFQSWTDAGHCPYRQSVLSGMIACRQKGVRRRRSSTVYLPISSCSRWLLRSSLVDVEFVVDLSTEGWRLRFTALVVDGTVSCAIGTGVKGRHWSLTKTRCMCSLGWFPSPSLVASCRQLRRFPSPAPSFRRDGAGAPLVRL